MASRCCCFCCCCCYLCCRKHRYTVSQNDQLPFLHGVLYATIHQAENLPNKDRQNRVKDQLNIKDFSDPYVLVFLDDFRIIKTSTVNNNLNPRWEERFRIDVANPTRYVRVQVKDEDIVGSDDGLGTVRLDAGRLLNERPINGVFNLVDKNGSPNGATIQFELQYKSAETLKKSIAIPECYFPLRKKCRVTLYQDAHTPPDPLFAQIKLGSGKPYSPTCAWKDIHGALNEAKRFIYFTGWSVYTQVALLRENSDINETLGEILIRKAEEGVQVLGMVWDEKLSTGVTPGLMGTHDEETAKYFADTKVKVVLVPRGRDGVLFNQFVSTCYSHHQKTVVLDAEGTVEGGGKRRIVAFVGGLDLTDGRWDTPTHHLFSSLQGYHKGDFYNASATVRREVGPRQPWHDIHARIEGLAALDVMQNFTERWHRQVSRLDHQLFHASSEEFNFDDAGSTEDEKWHVQLFRSINMDSAKFDPCLSFGLTGKRHRARDDSIQRAYMHHIRRARHFLYIENQYFQGSATMWKLPETGSNHLIPIEITDKICEKIKRGERFAAYIVVPMYPEGDPSSAPVQEMLHWQKCTMEMMFTKINKVLKKANSNALASDYLNFYCLGNGEDRVPEDLADPEPNTQESTLRNSKRFMVYVHSKMMIVDDEFIIIGSANINQRSMGGNRDTEIAFGAYQENHVVDREKGLPKGQVHGFRMALWSEHLACVENAFADPSSKACVSRVNKLAAENWKQYATDKPCDMKGHLMTYPVRIARDGTVKPLKQHKCFPDTSAAVLGKRSMFIPHKLTT